MGKVKRIRDNKNRRISKGEKKGIRRGELIKGKERGIGRRENGN